LLCAPGAPGLILTCFVTVSDQETRTEGRRRSPSLRPWSPSSASKRPGAHLRSSKKSARPGHPLDSRTLTLAGKWQLYLFGFVTESEQSRDAAIYIALFPVLADCTAASIGSIFSSDLWIEKSSSRIRSTWSANSLIVLGGKFESSIALKSYAFCAKNAVRYSTLNCALQLAKIPARFFA
jgi:hypothetical protein